MTTASDSFGREIKVGDLIYYRNRTLYASASMYAGKVLKITPKGQLQVKGFCTHGKTLADHIVDAEESWNKCMIPYGSPPWSVAQMVTETRLGDGLACIRPDPSDIEPDIRMILEQHCA